MNIGLCDVDSHNFPNLPLMKISAWHKSKGDDVEFALAGKEYDIVYMSKVFTESTEPEGIVAKNIIRGGSGYDLENKLPEMIEHTYPDYSLYPELTKDTAFGMLTRGCPRCKHKFCITPKKDGPVSVKVANLSEFWKGQKKIVLLDQNILACKDKIELLEQLAKSGAQVEFNGGIDVRFVNDEIIELLRKINVKDFHFAWDDPKEDLEPYFEMIKKSKIKNPNQIGVYVLTNFWSTIKEDLRRCYILRNMGFMPFVMIYDKQKFVDSRGRWLRGVEEKYSREELIHFKTCQHMQRWLGNRAIVKSCPDFEEYSPYKNWKNKGCPVPERKVTDGKSKGKEKE